MWELKLSVEKVKAVVVVVMQSQSLKGTFLQDMNGVLIGKKYDEISSYDQNDFRKRWRVLGRVPKDAYRANERSYD